MNSFDYTYERDQFWSARYPISKVLYGIYKFLAYTVIIIGGLWWLYMLAEGMGAYTWPTLLYCIISSLLMFFFSELTLMQVDKNYFLFKANEKVIDKSIV